MPEELVSDIFELRPATERREAPIPINAELPRGIVFKVQIGAFRNGISEQAFSDMTPVMGETVGNGLTRYTAGLFQNFDRASQAKDLVRERGYRDAFVVAYRDGERIPLGEAMRATAQAPAVATAQVPPVRTERPAAANTVLEPVVTPREQPAVAVIQAPVTTLPTPPADDIESLLTRYPKTADEVIRSFAPAPDATAYYNEPGAAPARQVETIQGLFYTVQVGVYSKPVPLGKLFNISPLNSERTETAKVRYTTGVFTDMELAKARREETVKLGVTDAFITAYLNGKRIPMREAAALVTKFGPAILARP
jgi:hypothetical protein